jgi:copper homeostasis protein
MTKVILECCANSVQSAINGQAGGAERIELCANLELGGTTPSAAAICMAREVLEIDLFVLIRPRAANFCYSELEMEEILQDIEFCKQVGCEGIVIGALTEEGNIDVKKTKKMVEAARPMKVTFHRAFDQVNDPLKALQKVIDCGCDRLLTSGTKETVKEGLEILKSLVKNGNDKITILPGGGLDSVSALQLYSLGLREFHLSATNKKQSPPRVTQIDIIENFIENFEEL